MGRSYAPAMVITPNNTRWWIRVICSPSVRKRKGIIPRLTKLVVTAVFTGCVTICFCIVAYYPTNRNYFPTTEIAQHRTTTSCSVADDSRRQLFLSLCSCESDNRGFNQNVIAFSLYGNFSDPQHYEQYVNPMKSILETINQVYPGNYFNYCHHLISQLNI